MDDTGSPLRIRTPPPDLDDTFESFKERRLKLQRRHYWQVGFTGMVVTLGIISAQVYLGYSMDSLEVQIVFVASLLIYVMGALILLTQSYPRRIADQPYDV